MLGKSIALIWRTAGRNQAERFAENLFQYSDMLQLVALAAHKAANAATKREEIFLNNEIQVQVVQLNR